MVPNRATHHIYQKDVNDVVLVSLLLNLNRFHTLIGVSIVDFGQVNAGLGGDVTKSSLITHFK